MKQEEMFRKITQETAVEQELVEKVYRSMVQIISETLSAGEEVVLIPEWGIFIPKLWDNPGRNENSQRTRQATHYKVRFRPGKEMEKQLKLPQGNHDEDGRNH